MRWTFAELQKAKAGQRVKIGGSVVMPHRPPTANGVCFFSLEDETGLSHVAALPNVYQKMGALIYSDGPVVVTGWAERRGEFII